MSLSLLANFVLMPVAAVVLARVLRLDEPLGVGLLLLGVAAGAPFLPKLTETPRAIWRPLMVLLMVITVGYLPLVLPILLPGVSGRPGEHRPLADCSDASPAGDFARGQCEAAARPRVPSRCSTASSLGLVLVVVLMVVVHFNSVLSLLGTGAILAVVLFIAFGYGRGMGAGWAGIGYGPSWVRGTAQRSVAAALVVGGQSFQRPQSSSWWSSSRSSVC